MTSPKKVCGMDEEEFIRSDYDGMTDAEVYVLLLLDDNPISRARVQRLLFLANVKLDLGLQFFEGKPLTEFPKDLFEKILGNKTFRNHWKGNIKWTRKSKCCQQAV